MTKEELKHAIKNAPSKPGLYTYKDSRNKYLYIGKALNIKNRLKNYLLTADPRLERMISDAQRIDFVETENDIEALILESQYIKKFQPSFNIMLRDDKQYFYVVFSNDEFSKISLTHQPTSGNFIGP